MKNENQEENKFMQMWNNKRTHAAMVLGLWGIFLLFVIVISYTGGNATKNEINNTLNKVQEKEKKVFKDYTEMQNNILNNNFTYEFIINVGTNKVVYHGVKKGIIDDGYRENALETVKYHIDETGLYKVLMDELHAMDKLYENVNESYLDLEYIFNEINNQSVVSEELEETRTFKYNYMIEDVNYEVVVTTDLNDITKIEIKFADNYYELNYSEINKKSEIEVN